MSECSSLRHTTTSNRRVGICLRLADVKRQRVSYFGRSNLEIGKGPNERLCRGTESRLSDWQMNA